MESKRILIVATSDIHLQVFHLPYIKLLREKGYQVDAAVEIRGNGQVAGINHLYNLPFKRTLFTAKLIKAYLGLKEIINNGNYNVIHCHTPIPAALTRLAAKQARIKGTKVLYTAHGFHFYKGAPLSYWLTYYPIEKWLSRYTDAIVTINKEDYDVVKTKFKRTVAYHINGIGVDLSRFKSLANTDKDQIKHSIGLPENAFTLLYAANFITRKNHQFIINCLPELKKEIPTLKVLFAGSGILIDKMKKQVKILGLEDTVHFMGFYKDINRLLAITDVAISASKQEGLGLALAEAMICNVPVVATKDRGHNELIKHGENGLLFTQNSKKEFIENIVMLYNNPQQAMMLSSRATKEINKFSIANSLTAMNTVYDKYLSK